MKSNIRTLVAAIALAVPLAAAAQAPVKIYDIVELSGGGATAGTNFDNGVEARLQGNQRRGRHPRPQDRRDLGRHAEQPRHRQGADAEGGRRRRVRRDGSGVLGLDHRQHGRNQEGRDPQLHRRRSGEHHAAGQPVHLPHVVHADDGDAEGREVPQERRQGEDGRRHVGEQRLRQGRPRLDREGARRAGHQGRRRHLDRSGPGRLLRRRC